MYNYEDLFQNVIILHEKLATCLLRQLLVDILFHHTDLIYFSYIFRRWYVSTEGSVGICE